MIDKQKTVLTKIKSALEKVNEINDVPIDDDGRISFQEAWDQRHEKNFYNHDYSRMSDNAADYEDPKVASGFVHLLQEAQTKEIMLEYLKDDAKYVSKADKKDLKRIIDYNIHDNKELNERDIKILVTLEKKVAEKKQRETFNRDELEALLKLSPQENERPHLRDAKFLDYLIDSNKFGLQGLDMSKSKLSESERITLNARLTNNLMDIVKANTKLHKERAKGETLKIINTLQDEKAFQNRTTEMRQFVEDIYKDEIVRDFGQPFGGADIKSYSSRKYLTNPDYPEIVARVIIDDLRETTNVLGHKRSLAIRNQSQNVIENTANRIAFLSGHSLDNEEFKRDKKTRYKIKRFSEDLIKDLSDKSVKAKKIERFTNFFKDIAYGYSKSKGLSAVQGAEAIGNKLQQELKSYKPPSKKSSKVRPKGVGR